MVRFPVSLARTSLVLKTVWKARLVTLSIHNVIHIQETRRARTSAGQGSMLASEWVNGSGEDDSTVVQGFVVLLPKDENGYFGTSMRTSKCSSCPFSISSIGIERKGQMPEAINGIRADTRL